MKLKARKGQYESYPCRRLFYTVCFVLFCIIDQRIKTGSGLDGIIETFRNMTGIVLAGIIISNYRMEEIIKRKRIYIVWGCLSAVAGTTLFVWGMSNRPFMNEWITVILNIILWGFILIYTFCNIISGKKRPVLNRKFFIIWLVMILLMAISRSDYIWPLCYGIMFGCFYLTDYRAEKQYDLCQGCLDGLILSFVLFQGFCCVFRPYDIVRYTGIHNNGNLNALYYLAVLAAAFTKILYAAKKGACKWIRTFWWLTAGIVASFLFMTISRTSWIVAFVMGLMFLGLLNTVMQKKRFIQNGLLLILCALLMFPVSFGVTRYLPPVFHHPVWFWGEWSEARVHSWDPWDSGKYVDIDILLENALGRIAHSVENLLEHSPFLLKSDAAEPEAEDPRIAAAVLEYEEEGDDILVRKTIYQYYFSHLNFRGHPYEEQGFQLTRYSWIGHAHNIYLQYGTDFGIPVMILFILLIVWSCIICWQRSRQRTSVADIAALFFILIPSLFGLFEYAWGAGSLSITLLFMAWRQAVRKEDSRETLKPAVSEDK